MSRVYNNLEVGDSIENAVPTSFQITKEQLSDLFQPDSIREGQSLKQIEDTGGVEGLLRNLKTHLKKGIDTSDISISDRIQAFGQNENITKAPKTFCELVMECLEDDVLRILCVACFVSLVIGCIKQGIAEGWIDGIGIFIAVFIIVTITSVNNYMKDKQFRKLNAQVAQRDVGVIRNGETVHISIYSLLVGDIMHIETGEVFPVDGFLIQGSNLVCDESSITGESDPIKKYSIGEHGKQPQPFLISGSKVIEGSGLMVVLAVGQMSRVGKQQALMNEEDEEEKKTPLQEKLDVFVEKIGSIGFKWAFVTVFCMLLNLLYTIYSSSDLKLLSIDTLSEIVDYIIVGITVVVIAVPEGLPLAVTLSLAYAVGKMKDENNLVRNLISCEIMGGADTICSDKTGTLTENKMKVKKMYALEDVHSQFNKQNFDQNFISLLTEGISVNSNAFPKIDDGKFEYNGNKTECALLELAYSFQVNYRDFRPSDNIIKVIPFSSARKRMTTVCKSKKGGQGTLRVYTKGAPEILIELCSKFINKSGQVQEINQSFLQKFQEIQQKFSNECLRTLLLAYKEIPNMDVEQLPEESQLEQDFIVLGMVGIQDPLRRGIRDSVRICSNAGVTVRMVTGDNKETAIAISKEAGIISQDYSTSDGGYTVMEGKQFRELVGGLQEIRGEDGKIQRYEVGNIDAFRDIIQDLRVLARSSPEDKFLLVTGLQKCDSVVAVTGDGTNDAPALKKADIGFAMGISGTEVAKEAAGIILIDDNFSSTITAIKWGRNIFDCIRKFLQFQLTINVVALFMAFLGGLVFRESPFNTIQILWVNLMQDTMAALALATEPPNDELLKRKPVKRTDAIVTPTMWKGIILQSIYQIVVLCVILFKGPSLFDVENGIQNKDWTEENGVHLTMFFNIFVFLSVFNEINCRKLKPSEINVFQGFFNNPLFLFIIVSTIFVQILMVQLGGRVAKCSPLSFEQNLICILVGASSVVAGIVIKLLPSQLDKLLNHTNPFQ
ncbi:hypothetical protein ABPG74_000080 [Tetrahymena malaccensis]